MQIPCQYIYKIETKHHITRLCFLQIKMMIIYMKFKENLYFCKARIIGI